MFNLLPSIITWTNENSGFLSLLIFIFALLLGWFSGFFKSFIQKTKFRIDRLDGPNCCSIVSTGKIINGETIHRTAFSVYLKIVNVGNVPASIDNVEAAFHWHLRPFSWTWIRYRLFWTWIRQPTVVLDSFKVSIGEQDKVYPLLLQNSHITHIPAETYLRVGQSVNGVIYFEGDDAWGGCFPALSKENVTKIKITIVDSFKRKHSIVVKIPVVPLSVSKQFCLSFGGSRSALDDTEEIDDFIK